MNQCIIPGGHVLTILRVTEICNWVFFRTQCIKMSLRALSAKKHSIVQPVSISQICIHRIPVSICEHVGIYMIWLDLESFYWNKPFDCTWNNGDMSPGCLLSPAARSLRYSRTYLQPARSRSTENTEHGLTGPVIGGKDANPEIILENAMYLGVSNTEHVLRK